MATKGPRATKGPMATKVTIKTKVAMVTNVTINTKSTIALKAQIAQNLTLAVWLHMKYGLVYKSISYRKGLRICQINPFSFCWANDYIFQVLALA